LLLAPLVFQILMGTKGLYKVNSLKFWKVCLISLIGQIILTISCSAIMWRFLEKSGTHERLPVVGVIVISSFLGSVLIITLILQLILRLLREKK
jgi:hypothetical protein